MSPRRNFPKGRRPKTEDRDISTSNQTVEEHADGDFIGRKITGSSSNKPYRCPGCDQEIRMGTPHVVAWVEEDAETRRHWHTPCWESRNRRAPKIERTRNAPRY